jgi:uncharacterized membrane protein YdjX (TVP38/TMEM64 family)
MHWVSSLLQQIAGLGAWGAVLFVLVYVAATVTLSPAFLLTLTAGAVYGIWKGTALVFVGASLGASAAYVVAVRLSGTRALSWLDRNPRIAVVRGAVRHESAWVQFLLRLSPVIPFTLLNYALGLAHVRFKDFAVALVGMIPAIVLYAYYGKVVGDVARLAAGVTPPRGTAYYTLVGVGLLATGLATHSITRAARRAIDEQRRRHPSSTSPVPPPA